MIYRIPLASLAAKTDPTLDDVGATFIVVVELKADNPARTHKEPKEWGFGPGIPVDFNGGI